MPSGIVGSYIQIAVIKEINNDIKLPGISTFQHKLLGSIQIEESDVLDILCNLDTSKVTGPDGISPKLLKECLSNRSASVSHIQSFSYVWRAAKHLVESKCRACV